MTKSQFKEKCEELEKIMEEDFDFSLKLVLESESIDMDIYIDDYTLPMVFLCSFGKKLYGQFMPITRELKEIKRKINCII